MTAHGIDPTRIYFREDIARLWGRNINSNKYTQLPALLNNL